VVGVTTILVPVEWLRDGDEETPLISKPYEPAGKLAGSVTFRVEEAELLKSGVTGFALTVTATPAGSS